MGASEIRSATQKYAVVARQANRSQEVLMKSIRSIVPLVPLVALVAACSTDQSPVAPGPRPRLGAEVEDQPQYSDWSQPVNLGSVINSGSNEQHPAISKDGLSLYFASDRAGTGGWVGSTSTSPSARASTTPGVHR